MKDQHEIYAIVTQSIIDALEQGVAPWRRSWAKLEQRSVKGHTYRGINAMALATMSTIKGYSDPRWITFRECKNRGGHVRKGEKSVPLILWKPAKRRAKNDDEKDGTFLLVRYYRVFNVEQCDGLELPSLPETVEHDHDPIAACDAVVDGYKSGPTIQHGGGQAAYRPSTDTVHMPRLKHFDTPEDYYGVLFHELTHSTGHAGRLARDGVTIPHMFGSHDYSREELVAELGAAFLGARTGINAPLLENSAAYCQSWLRKLHEDPKMLVHAAQQAQKAADHILGESAS